MSVDITTSLGHTADPADIRAALARTETVGGVDGGEALPVLSRADALLHALARLAPRPRWSGLADAARLALAAPDLSPRGRGAASGGGPLGLGGAAHPPA
ncbi:hypothetical protein [Streptomyces kaempferi]|uniref:Uncharacterized protein n=1 Tax=Streptomyces kaempferi TaxID=333725 RepID=A0ABW3XZ03_9ACTN